MRIRRRRPAQAKPEKAKREKPASRTPARRQKIRCPLCAWEPDGGKYWGCDKCGAIFDTFVTRAHCPRCPQSWAWTQCIACHKSSDHEKWYVDEAG